MTDSAGQLAQLRPDETLQQAVLDRVRPLQRAQLAGAPSASARLARLRRALNAAPGSVAEVWSDTTGALPAQLLGTGDEPSAYEVAVHVAMCHYALHQQSQSLGMHVARQDLGTAVQILRRRRGSGEDEVDPVLRRFHQLATASSQVETLHHLRGLVTLLRDEQVGLDYGQLAVDLRRLQKSSTALSVRLKWGRSLYRRPLPRTPITTASPEPTFDVPGVDA